MRLLGSPIGSESFVDGYIKDTIDTWLHDLDVLCTFAESQPQAAYAAFTHGLFSRWAYFFRSCSVPSEHLSALDEMIRCKLIPALSGKYATNDLERTWLALPIRHGLIIPSAFAESPYTASPELTQPLVGCLLDGQKYLPYEVFENQCRLLDSYLRKKRSGSMTELQAVRDQLDVDKVRLLDEAGERGASVWLSALPLSHHGFDLHKSSFRDAVCIWYGWQPQDLPSSCVCGSAFSIDHALSCPMGGFPTLWHNELRDLIGSLLADVCSNVAREPTLQPLSGESLPLSSSVDGDGARADIAADGFWGIPHQRAFFDVSVVNPFSNSYKGLTLPAV